MSSSSSSSSSSVCVRMSSAEGYEFEYKFLQDGGIYDEPGMVWNLPSSLMGKKVVNILFKAKYLVQRLPTLYAGPVETLGIVHTGLVVALDDIEDEFYAGVLSDHIFSNLLNLPRQHHSSLISQLAAAANSLFARPENSDLLLLPFHFNARVTTVQQDGENLDATLARAITPPPDQQMRYNYHVYAARAPKSWPPMSPAQELFIESLEKERVRVGQSHDHHDQDPCSICLHRFSLGDDISFLPCHHVYHSGCIIPWLRNRFSCPLCRRPPAAMSKSS